MGSNGGKVVLCCESRRGRWCVLKEVLCSIGEEVVCSKGVAVSQGTVGDVLKSRRCVLRQVIRSKEVEEMCSMGDVMF